MAATQEGPEAREVVVGAVGALAQVRADSGTMCSSAMPAALLGIVGLSVKLHVSARGLAVDTNGSMWRSSQASCS